MEIYAISLVARYNRKQNEIYQSSANIVVGTVYENFSSVRRFFSVSQIADSLATENSRLKTTLESTKYLVPVSKGTVIFPLDTSTIRPDTTQKKDVLQQFNYLSAEVVNNSINRNENYITINRGRLQGISAMIKRNRYFGSLVWRGGNPKEMILESIPKHADIVKGDSIVTSGFSEMFPGGIFIGRVTEVKIESGSNSFTLTVELNNDISNEAYVYVIDNLLYQELNKINEDIAPKKR
jgi:rod shape-determining protein MreC